ncbi:hypothetical protein SISNIDRAFT_407635 [Sistotremastrum niveocremeum HHB9708]|uniref:Exoribonuclease phosphorolytic domain-containing protein n=1 Tax=Sistotremastrum niveocremeum HHB9708 TaxID=1314777 RepID=A0A164Y086_9AGAM|nr:hypothetical protein SISNIDRAFT_407635 [Sistotremastrum niveocremeum HHB9708]
MRPVTIHFERLDRVDGSARFGFGDTTVLASVSGPIEVRLAAELASKATFEVTVRPLSGIPGTESKSLASSIRSLLSPIFIFTQNPRSLIQLVIQSLTPSPRSSPSQSFSPSLVAAMINASMLALLRASSFPLKGVICAVAVGKKSFGDHELVLDPEGEVAQGGCFAFLFGGGGKEEEVVWTNWKSGRGWEADMAVDGDADADLDDARELARKAAREVYASIRKAIAQEGGEVVMDVD